MKSLFPSRALLVLVAIGFVDLVTTAWLHANGMIVELNPIMRVLIERSEWLFAFVKGVTLLVGWLTMAWYAKSNREFVSRVCKYGTLAYVGVWCMWFLSAH